MPVAWALTQANLASALQMLGERLNDPAPLGDAVNAYRAALEVYTPEAMPAAWAITQTNLGSALQTLGEHESGTAWLEEAVAAYEAALKVFEDSAATYHIEVTRTNLASAEALLLERSRPLSEPAIADQKCTETPAAADIGSTGPNVFQPCAVVLTTHTNSPGLE
jgi:tetratricopeptide (TPR) repeat protein